MNEKSEELKKLRTQRDQFMREGKWEQALEQLNAMIAIAPAASRYTRRGMLLIKLNRYAEALSDIEKALELDPKEQRAEKVLCKLLTLTERSENKTSAKDALVTDSEEPKEADGALIIYSPTEAFLAQQVHQLMLDRKKAELAASKLDAARASLNLTTHVQKASDSVVTRNEVLFASVSGILVPEMAGPATNTDALANDKTEVTSRQGSENIHITTINAVANSQTELVCPPVDEHANTVPTVAQSEEGQTVSADLAGGKAIKPGTRLGQYILQEKIGQGGMGCVYKAMHTELKQVVAIKILLVNDSSPEQIQRFYQEAQLAAKLQHPHIVPIFNFGVEQNVPYLVMQWVDGVPLSLLLQQKKPSPRQTLDIALQIAQAMAYAHASGVIHRDLKPSNIMIDRWGRAQVFDFGIAKSRHTTQELTQQGQILGTPKYMSPEQAYGNVAAVDEQSDVYAVGVMLYEMLTGKCPFDGDSAYSIIYKILHEEPIAPRKLNPRLHQDLQTLVEKAMSREKKLRYQSMRALHEDMERYLRGEAILARPPSVSYRVGKWIFRHPAFSSLLTLVVLLGITAAIWYGFFYDPQQRLKLMYRQARSLEEKNIILSILSTQAKRPEQAFFRQVLDAEPARLQALALRTLADLGATLPQEKMEHYLTSQDEELGLAAIYTIGRSRLTSLAPKLRKFLAPDNDWRTRLCALEALGALEIEEIIPICCETLGDNYQLCDVAKKILLRFREKSLPHLVDIFLGPSGSKAEKAGQILEMLGPPLIASLKKRISACDKSDQTRILELVARIPGPESIEFLQESLATAALERCAFSLLHQLQDGHPHTQRIARILAEHPRKFYLMAEGPRYCLFNEEWPVTVKLLASPQRVFQNGKLLLKLPPKVSLTKHDPAAVYNQENNTWQWPVPQTIPGEGMPVSLGLRAAVIGQVTWHIEFYEGEERRDSLDYSLEAGGVASSHNSMYDTDDPILVGKDTLYNVQIRNEGLTPLTNLRLVVRLTPELELTKIVLEGKGTSPTKATITSMVQDKGIIFLHKPLEAGEPFSYKIYCKAARPGAALCTVSLTYDEFAREISFSEGTMVYGKEPVK